jgi:DMSO/TMAO reductase YedYZ molybdopterin-dependent catalytic subunit
MKKLNINLLLMLLVIVFLPCCSPEPKSLTLTNGSDRKTSIKNMITPNGERLLPAEDGTVRSALGEPIIDLNTFKLEITGLVDSSFYLTWDEIRGLLEFQTDTILMYCVEGWEVWGRWEGIMVKNLLDKARVQTKGEYVLFSSADGYTTSLPISYLEKYNAILAYNVNGSPLKVSDGFPLRLIAFGKYGYKWAKWVDKLTVIDKSQAGYWESYGFPDQADVPILRRSYYEGLNAKPLEY